VQLGAITERQSSPSSAMQLVPIPIRVVAETCPRIANS
jgi:hypothetical protein